MIYLGKNQTNYLQHYGVLGMRWGHHRYKAIMRNAKKVRESAKEWDEIAAAERERGKKRPSGYYDHYKNIHLDAANKLEAKASKIKAKHERLAGGKASYDYTTQQSMGKTILKSMIMGTYGTLKYNQSRAKGKDAVSAYGKSIVSNLLNAATGGIARYAEPRISNPKNKSR